MLLWEASTTAGSRLATAVPELVMTAAGRLQDTGLQSQECEFYTLEKGVKVNPQLLSTYSVRLHVTGIMHASRKDTLIHKP